MTQNATYRISDELLANLNNHLGDAAILPLLPDEFTLDEFHRASSSLEEEIDAQEEIIKEKRLWTRSAKRAWTQANNALKKEVRRRTQADKRLLGDE